MRTYSRRDFEAARDAWAWGRFGSEWEPYRRAAAERGFIYPPAGSPDDDPTAEDPSQRSVIHEAMDNTPRALLAAIRLSRSWSEVVARMTQHRASLREDADLAERDAHWAKAQFELSRRETLQALAEILRRTPA